MKVPYSWLQDFLDIKAAPDTIAQYLTMAGVEVSAIEHHEGDVIFDIEITSNRPDLLSVYGVARELAAVTSKSLKKDYYKKSAARVQATRKKLITVADKKACPLYIGLVIEGVRVGPSSEYLKKKIEAAGVRSVNNIVDITNYFLLEVGQPMHAFDYDVLGSGRVIVRRAREKETLRVIDGTMLSLEKDHLVIADSIKPVALAGVMGGKDSEVSTSTKNIFLESARFDPVVTRRTSRHAGIGSESSYRFERGVDFLMVPRAAFACARMICEIAGGTITCWAQEGTMPCPGAPITISEDYVAAILGQKIPLSFMSARLKALGFSVKTGGKKTLRVERPSFRNDITQPADIVEEVARLWGYEKFPLTLASSAKTMLGPRARYEAHRLDSFFVRQEISDHMASLGLQEIITYALISPAQAAYSEVSGDEAITIQNPLSEDQKVLRTSLVASMAGAVAWNIKRGVEGTSFFEQSKVYRAVAGASVQEEEKLCIGLYGKKPAHWKQARDIEFDFFDLKGVAERILEKVGLACHVAAHESILFEPGASCAVESATRERIGTMGRVRKELLRLFDIETRCVYAAEFSMPKLCAAYAKKHVAYKPIPRYPASQRDVSLVVPKAATNADIGAVIRETGGALLEEVVLFDTYTGTQIPSDKKALSYSLFYRSNERTLLTQEVDALHTAIIKALAQRLGATVR